MAAYNQRSGTVRHADQAYHRHRDRNRSGPRVGGRGVTFRELFGLGYGRFFGMDNRTLPKQGRGPRLERLRVCQDIRHCRQGLDALLSSRVQARVPEQPFEALKAEASRCRTST